MGCPLHSPRVVARVLQGDILSAEFASGTINSRVMSLSSSPLHCSVDLRNIACVHRKLRNLWMLFSFLPSVRILSAADLTGRLLACGGWIVGPLGFIYANFYAKLGTNGIMCHWIVYGRCVKCSLGGTGRRIRGCGCSISLFVCWNISLLTSICSTRRNLKHSSSIHASQMAFILLWSSLW